MLLRRIAIAQLLLVPLIGHAQASTSPPLRIAVEDGADPWSRPDGTGFANDLVRAAFRAVGVTVEFTVVPYARCKRAVVEGSVVGCVSMSTEPGLSGTVAFPTGPLFICFTELFQDPAHPLPVRRIADLPRGTVIGTVIGYEYPAELTRARTAGTIVLDESASEAILVRKLAAGRVRGAILNVNATKPATYIAWKAGVTVAPERVARVGALPSYIGFSIRHPRGSWAREQFEAGFKRITSDGTVARLTRAWTDSAAIK